MSPTIRAYEYRSTGADISLSLADRTTTKNADQKRSVSIRMTEGPVKTSGSNLKGRIFSYIGLRFVMIPAAKVEQPVFFERVKVYETGVFLHVQFDFLGFMPSGHWGRTFSKKERV